MISLQSITTRCDGSIELETCGLLRKDHLTPLRLHRFEWAFGMDNESFDVASDINRLTVHRDLIPLIHSSNLAFNPVQGVINKAISMMEHNSRVTLDERQRFEDFGTGPWEYILFSTKAPGSNIPPLYYRSPDGTTTAFHFDLSDPENLPHFTSTIHPLVVLFFRRIHHLFREYVAPSLHDPVVQPVRELTDSWPYWIHNRFLPEVTSPIRKRPDADYCRCADCREWGTLVL
ncbi:hypothetical protein PM082_000295 [Marasmius tenuissimus]|nr:hypothetical protein PM082_000295 [Marasmius tenuissimus]